MKGSIFVLFTFILSLSCVSAPRYSSENIDLSGNGKKSKKVLYGVSSFYGLNDGFDGNLTANGEVYDKDGISAAHKTLPLNSIVKVTNLDNGKTLTMKINDRGPYIKGRILDCSYGAAQKLDFVENGTANVKIKVIKLGDNVYKKQK